MRQTLHVTSGDIAGELLAEAGIQGTILVWHDILYDGPRKAGWPTSEHLEIRAAFLEKMTAGGVTKEKALQTLADQYQALKNSSNYQQISLWFDGCLFDQSMLVHILACLHDLQCTEGVNLLCIDHYPGVEPFNGIGQLQPADLLPLQHEHSPVTKEQFAYALLADKAFSTNNTEELKKISKGVNEPLPHIPAAAKRLLAEKPDNDGLGKLERLALRAIQEGNTKPSEIFKTVSKLDTPPQYWGDITLWEKINGLASRSVPLVKITGPTSRLPQWESPFPLDDYTIRPA